MTSQKQKQNHYSHHNPVLLEPSVELLSPGAGESYLDLTAGYGGHASEIIDRTKAADKAILVDRDPSAIKELQKLRYESGRPQIRHLAFETAARQLGEEGKHFDMILLDLGVSSPQLDNRARGFSFLHEGPLDMRMDQAAGLTAADIVNTQNQESIEEIIRLYGEEPQAKKIAQAIVEARPYKTTTQLAEVISKTIGRRGKRHPATRTFQALRIAVNDELGQLTRTLPLLIGMLERKGRLAIISFHSLEDREVKNFFKEESSSGFEANLELLTKKPILGKAHDALNPRARSSVLRVAQRK